MTQLSPATLRFARGEIVPLTSLRGVAAMAVVLQHFSATAQLHSAVRIPSLVPHGYVAVDLFFVLSGFIMSYTYLDSFQARRPGAFAAFLSKRIARIVPLNTAAVLLCVLVGEASLALLGHNIVFRSEHLLGDMAANIAMLQGFGIGLNLNGPSWSICVEAAAYLAFPAFILAVFSARREIWAATLLACLLALCGLAVHQPRLGMSYDGPPLSLVRCFAEFGLGMLSYRLAAQTRARRLLGSDSAAFLLIIGCGLAMLVRVDLAAVLLFPPLVVALALNAGAVARIMSARFLHFLGVISFSLYLIHNVFRDIDLAILRALHPALFSGPAALCFALAGSLAVIPFAWVSYVAVERPGRRWLRRG